MKAKEVWGNEVQTEFMNRWMLQPGGVDHMTSSARRQKNAQLCEIVRSLLELRKGLQGVQWAQ